MAEIMNEEVVAPPPPPPAAVAEVSNEVKLFNKWTFSDVTPFFVLHKGSPRNCARRSVSRSKPITRRRINLTHLSPNSSEKSEAPDQDNVDDDLDNHFKLDIFHNGWSKIDNAIREVLRNSTADVYDEVHRWIEESFAAIRLRRISDQSGCIQSYPIATDPLSKLIPTGLLLTKNMEFVDDIMTFEDLGVNLKIHGFHVASLSSFDFSAKNGIAGCLRSLLRQFMVVSPEVADLSILASWYAEQGSCDEYPLVVIIDDMQKCCGSVLSEFILILSEWALKLPVILIFGVATSIDALKNILPINALQHVSPHRFVLGSPTERMDAIIEAVLVKQCSNFSVGHKVAIFLRNYFIKQDGTLTSFIRALKIAVVQHIATEPRGDALIHVFKDGGQVNLNENNLSAERDLSLPDTLIKRDFEFRSCKRNALAEPKGELVAQGLSNMKKLQKMWSSVVMCLYEAGKSHHITLLDVLSEALNPDLYPSINYDIDLGVGSKVEKATDDHPVDELLLNSGVISQVIGKVRILPQMILRQMLSIWENHTEGIPKIQKEVRELKSLLGSKDEEESKQDVTDTSKRQRKRFISNNGRDAETLNEKAAAMLKDMLKKYMMPVERMAFHEFSCFKDVPKLQSALIGDPRRAVQVDLLEFHKVLKCNCCSKSDHFPSPYMHDTSIMYILAQEHGDLINLHDWYQSFKTTILQSRTKAKNRLKHSPSPKKRKTVKDSPKKSEAAIQAEFCRAVTELQITGLLRMPSKRRPDYVQRVAFGI